MSHNEAKLVVILKWLPE